MAQLNILEFPDPRLRQRASPVERVTPRVTALIDDMLETMYAAPGIGLAASQVDVHKRIVVVDVSDSHDQPYALVNPTIEVLGGLQQREEGCLSVPGFFEQVERADRIRVLALDKLGNAQEFDADGLLSVCIQHECDHLDGVLMTDRASELVYRSELERDPEYFNQFVDYQITAT